MAAEATTINTIDGNAFINDKNAAAGIKISGTSSDPIAKI
jgi:hypothetical protein